MGRLPKFILDFCVCFCVCVCHTEMDSQIQVLISKFNTFWGAVAVTVCSVYRQGLCTYVSSILLKSLMRQVQMIVNILTTVRSCL